MTDLVASYLIFSNRFCHRNFLTTFWILIILLLIILYFMSAARSLRWILSTLRDLKKIFTWVLKTAFLYIIFIRFAELILSFLFSLVKDSKWFRVDYFISIFLCPNKIWFSSNYFLAYLLMIFWLYFLKSSSVLYFFTS